MEWAALLLLICLGGRDRLSRPRLRGLCAVVWRWLPGSCGAVHRAAAPGKGADRGRVWCAWRVMLLVLAARMLWCGWALNIAGGTGPAAWPFRWRCRAWCRTCWKWPCFPARVMLGGLLGLAAYIRSVRWPALRISRMAGLSILLPFVTFLAFSLLFILANPDLLNSFGEQVSQFLQGVRAWLIDYSPEPAEILFWCFVGWMALGMMRPLLSRPLFEDWAREEQHRKRGGAPSPSPLYAACRNTLADRHRAVCRLLGLRVPDALVPRVPAGVLLFRLCPSGCGVVDGGFGAGHGHSVAGLSRYDPA